LEKHLKQINTFAFLESNVNPITIEKL